MCTYNGGDQAEMLLGFGGRLIEKASSCDYADQFLSSSIHSGTITLTPSREDTMARGLLFLNEEQGVPMIVRV